MAPSPPGSPAGGGVQRPVSAMIRSNRSPSRMSMSSRQGGGSRASDDDGKTAVKVAVRVRPPLQPSDPGYDLVPQRFRGSTCHVTSPTSLTVESAQGKKLFVFDRVFSENVDQEGVWEYLGESVNSFVLGYNVSILAYGQSGAGKSYTMGTTGPKEQSDPSLMGIVPRAAIALFEKLCGPCSSRTSASGLRPPSRYSSHGLPTLQSFSKTAEKNWQMKATYVEIYNEQLRDLLIPESVPQSERAPVAIREDAKGRIILTGLQQVTINSVDDLLSALNFGSSIRQTDATAVNAKSSRSHAVFSLNLIQKRSKSMPSSAHEKRFSVPIEAMSGSESWVTVDSKLHFVDLAGSERLKNTGAQGERAKEGISINAGLASLGKVISQLSSRSAGSHVSYRDSRLTRLLQDSLGGNAITYMVACVTPAEFHLSETLNTVQYAQRARAIQSRPEIQQVSDDSDKQAVIDRLRAEVSFLRDQIRLSERADRRNNAPQEKAERQHEREVELQNQLLDVQENYSALSQRHAKLISEIAKARDSEFEDTSSLKDSIGDSAVERLKRSNSFAEAVEQVVLEYEKTIQSLEASLSSTRSSLASSESTLLEKETKIAYMENVTQQLQARIQKAMDREADDETYLHDLEAKVAGVTSGEEKSHAVIQSLRKELSKARGNETACEQYISTLEERLTEADQDHEIMQREIERLEHVVERQRSIGKLDNLLYELDHMRQTESSVENGATTNGHLKKDSGSFHSFAPSELTNEDEDLDGAGRAEKQSSETGAETEVEAPPVVSGSNGADLDVKDNEDVSRTPVAKSLAPAAMDTPQSFAQSKAVADKLETVTQELFDLKMEHESTINDYDELSRKYQLALNTLAELQDAVDEVRSVGLREGSSPVSTRPTSFLADAGVNGHEEDGQPSSSRTLLSELSLLGEPPNTMGASDVETAHKRFGSLEAVNISQKEEQLAREMEMLKKLNAEKEENMAELTKNYAQLQEKHQDTLDYVEELKAKVQRAHLARPASPSAQVLRRKSSQNVMASERVNRSMVSLRNIAAENFEGQPDVIQNFEINLNAVITELQTRTERVTELEAELASARKEMESKMTIISGLTRERSSLKASSPMDISVMSTMRDQLLESENQIRALREAHAVREQNLLEQIESFKAMPEVHGVHREDMLEKGENRDSSSHMPGLFPETPAPELGTMRELGTEAATSANSQEQITQLEKQVEEWKVEHLASLESMKASEQQLLATISGLESSLRKAESLQAETANGIVQKSAGTVTSRESENESSHQEVVAALQREVDEHKTIAATNAVRLAELEHSYASILRQVEDDTRSKELTEKELNTLRHLVTNLESQLDEHKSVIAIHQQNVKSLQESHSEETERLKAAALAAETESNERLTAQTANHGDAALALQDELVQIRSQHEGAIASLQDELGKAQAQTAELVKGVASALKKETDASQLQSHVRALVDERRNLLTQHEQATADLQAVRNELDAAKASVSELQNKVEELRTINEETIVELQAIREKEKKSSRLVEELEDQLNSNYDQHQAANNRLSALQTERQVQLEEALQTKSEVERELDEARARVKQLESQLHDGKRNSHRESLDPRDATLQRSNSGNSNARKSASHNSLPSPPPAIPLPPLPGSPPSASSAPSPPTSRHQSKDIAQAQLFDDQEARIRTIEKHLFAEKQLTATLEEALTDLEASSTRLKSDMDDWRKKCVSLEDELNVMKKERNISRYSLQQVEEERNARMRVEADRANLEARMAQLSAANKKKKKSNLNCF